MQHISGISRQQIQISSLEDKITSENPVGLPKPLLRTFRSKHLALQLKAQSRETLRSVLREKENTIKSPFFTPKKKRM